MRLTRVRHSACRRGGSSFFQAEDGIRYSSVTGVQTCALPISAPTTTQSTCSLILSALSPSGSRLSDGVRHECPTDHLDTLEFPGPENHAPRGNEKALLNRFQEGLIGG